MTKAQETNFKNLIKIKTESVKIKANSKYE